MTNQKVRVLKVYWNDSYRYLENDLEDDLPQELIERLDCVSRSTLYKLNNSPSIIDNLNIDFLEDYFIEITDLNHLLTKTKDIDFDCIFMLSFGTMIHDHKRIIAGIDKLFKDTPSFSIAGHLMHVGLWKKHRPEFNNLFTLHQQACVISRNVIEELRSENFVFNNNLEYETDCWYNVGRSEENIHDDYTPEWISKGDSIDPIPMYKNHEFGFGEDLIQFAIKKDWKLINLNNDLRKGKCFSYYMQDPYDLLRLIKIKEKSELFKIQNEVSEEHYKFVINLTTANNDRFFAYNNESIYDNLQDLDYDCFVGPAPGYLPWQYLSSYKFTKDTKVLFVDLNDHALQFQEWFLYNFDPDLDISWESWIKKFTKQYPEKLDNILDDQYCVEKSNKTWKESIYPLLKVKWQEIKNYNFTFKRSTIINDELVGDFIRSSNQPLVWTSNIFNFILSWSEPDVINGYVDFINNLIINNINAQWCGNTPWGLEDRSYIVSEDILPVDYFLQKHIPEFNSKQFLKEIAILEENNLFTQHRGGTGRGWESFVIHGLGYNKTEHFDNYGFKSNEDAPYHFTQEAKKYAPTIVKYFEDNLASFHENCYHRVRIMKLSPDGYIGVHNDNEENDNIWALNVAINNPQECKMHFWNRQMQYLGIVPWEPVSAFKIRIGMNHMVLNKSNETRYHMIIHGD